MPAPRWQVAAVWSGAGGMRGTISRSTCREGLLHQQDDRRTEQHAPAQGASPAQGRVPARAIERDGRLVVLGDPKGRASFARRCRGVSQRPAAHVRSPVGVALCTASSSTYPSPSSRRVWATRTRARTRPGACAAIRRPGDGSESASMLAEREPSAAHHLAVRHRDEVPHRRSRQVTSNSAATASAARSPNAGRTFLARPWATSTPMDRRPRAWPDEPGQRFRVRRRSDDSASRRQGLPEPGHGGGPGSALWGPSPLQAHRPRPAAVHGAQVRRDLWRALPRREDVSAPRAQGEARRR